VKKRQKDREREKEIKMERKLIWFLSKPVGLPF